MSLALYLWIAGVTATCVLAGGILWLRSDASCDAVGEFGPVACAFVVVVAALLSGLAWPLAVVVASVALLLRRF